MSSKILLPQLVSMLAANAGISKNTAETFIKAFFSQISGSLEKHESIKIKDFGTFKISSVEARKSVNVATGEDFEIPPHYKVTFTPSKNLAETVNEEFGWLDIVELSDDISNDELEELRTERVEVAVPLEKPYNSFSQEPASANPSEHPEPQAKSHNETEKIEESERLGEEIEKEFGDIEPVEPLGPIEPDSPEPDTPITEPPVQKEEEFDPYAQNIKKEIVPVDKNEIVLISKEEYENLPNRADMKAISRHIKRMKSTIAENEESGKKRNLRYFIWGIVISLLLVTGGLFLLYGIMTHKGFEVRKKYEPNMLDNKDYQASTNTTDDEQVSVEIKNTSSYNNLNEGSTKDKGTVPSDETIKNKQDKDENSKNAADVKDSKETTSQASEIKAMDKVTNTRYLTTMAKEHYGNYNLWPYIYLENEAKLGHPDKITPGTVVAIPDISKYGVDPSNKKDIEKARRLGIEIYKKYAN